MDEFIFHIGMVNRCLSDMPYLLKELKEKEHLLGEIRHKNLNVRRQQFIDERFKQQIFEA